MIFLGVDVGSTASKCVAFDEGGNRLASHYQEYPLPSGTENLPPPLLLEAVFSAIIGCAAAIERKSEIASITVSSFGESFVPVSKAGKPLTDIIMYFSDQARGELDRVVDAVGAERLMRITRAMPDTMYALPKMIWTMEHTRERVWKFLSIADYIGYTLTGETATNPSLACRTLLFDVHRRRWSDELLRAAGVEPDQLPQVLPSGTAIGALRPEVADRLGLPPGVKVVAGAHDQVANAFGAGVIREGEGVDGTGTVECITPMFGHMPGDLSFLRQNYVCIPYFGGYVTYAFNLTGGSLVKWFRDTLASGLKSEAAARGVSAYDLLNQGCPSEPSGLFAVPHFQGAGGTPETVRGARGLIHGMTLDTNVYDLYRAVLEGLCYEMAHNMDVLRGHGVAPTRLFASGGGARSDVWLQIKADILGCEIHPVAEQECGALGSAMFGALACGRCRDEADAVHLFTKTKPPVVPDEKRAAHYRERRETYMKLRGFSLALREV